MNNKEAKAFVLEAVVCAENGLHRAAVVLSWQGALALLYDYVHRGRLAEFNAEVTRRDPKWRVALTTDDMARLKERDFLDVLEALSVVGKSVKQALQGALQLRNGCGHPNSLKIGSAAVGSHLETLLLNVFVPFGSN